MASKTNPVALIVGGSSGMGKEIARRLLQEGKSVLLLARDAKKLEAAGEELSAMGSVETAEVDLYDEAAVDRYVSKLDADPRHVKFLVNAAGAFRGSVATTQGRGLVG